MDPLEQQMPSNSVSDWKEYDFKRGKKCPIVPPSLPEPLVSTTPEEAISENGHIMANFHDTTTRRYIDPDLHQVRMHEEISRSSSVPSLIYCVPTHHPLCQSRDTATDSQAQELESNVAFLKIQKQQQSNQYTKIRGRIDPQ